MKKVGIISVPYDENSSFEKGPAKAPSAILDYFANGSLNKGTENGQLLKINENVHILPTVNICRPDEFFSQLEASISDSLSNGYHLLSLGGDHSITFPIVSAYQKLYPDLTIVHFDAHSDLYHEFKGNRYSNACPFARIMESGLAAGLHQYGIRTMTEHQWQQANKFNVDVNEMKDWPSAIPEIKGPIYISIDIDAIDPAFAPGVSHREPGGLTSRDIINFIHALPNNVVGIDIVEFNPNKDIDDITLNLSTKLVKESLGKLLESI